MNVFDRRQHQKLDQLVEEHNHKGLSRRVFLQRAMSAGLTASAAGALLAACGGSTGNSGGSSSTPTTIDVLNVWGADEQASFKAVVAPFTAKTKITVNIESTRDLDAVLTTRLRGNNPPDIAILPNPGKVKQFASQKKLKPLDGFLDMNQMKSDYSASWLDLGSLDGTLYALSYKVANKGTVWYSPTQFKAINAETPKTWDDLIKLSDSIANKGKYPWAMGVESAASSGWPASDWIAQIFLEQSGPDLYDQWIDHKIPWTHDGIKKAFQSFGQIAGGKHYINGAPQSILATNFQPASYGPFANPPTSYMYYLGDFAAGFITGQYKDAKPGTDFNFFAFPTINTQYQGAVTGGADLVTAMKDNGAVSQFVKYLATAEAQTIWVKRGGFTSVNKSVDLTVYPNPVAQASAKMLTDASIFRFGAGDLMPSEVQQAFWKGTLAFIGDQKQLDSILGTIESTAQSAYTS